MVIVSDAALTNVFVVEPICENSCDGGRCYSQFVIVFEQRICVRATDRLVIRTLRIRQTKQMMKNNTIVDVFCTCWIAGVIAWVRGCVVVVRVNGSIHSI